MFRQLGSLTLVLSLSSCIVKHGPSAAQPSPVYATQPAPVYAAQPAPVYAAQPAPTHAPPAQSGSAQPTVATGYTTERIVDDDGNTLLVQQGARGEPSAVGCADGQREGLVDVARYPRIAACLGQWTGTQSLRARPTGRACGDDLGACATPADLCAPGWRVCGANGAIADISQLSADECSHAGTPRFSAAISHCENQDGCNYDRDGGNADGRYECFESGWCSEAVCCGEACGQFGICTDGVWPGATHIAQGTDQGCGAMTSLRAGGVLCCR